MTALDAVLAAFLCASVYTDLRWRKVPNAVVLAAVLLGALLRAVYGGMAGLAEGAAGLLAGLLLLVIPFAAGGIGAGDVKVLAVVGLYEGARFAAWTFAAGAVAGGALAAASLLARGRLGASVRRIASHLWVAWAARRLSLALVPPGGGEGLPAVPYTLAIVCGAAFTFFFGP